MNIDTWLFIAIGILSVAMAVLGGIVSSREPLVRGAFIVMGIASVICIVWEGKIMQSPATPAQIASELVPLLGGRDVSPSKSASAREIAEAVVAKLPKGQKPSNPTTTGSQDDTVQLSSLATNVARQMFNEHQIWAQLDEGLYTKRSMAALTPNEDERKQKIADIERQRQELSQQYSSKIRLMVDSADKLRQQLLNKINPSDRTNLDRQEAVVFDRVLNGETITHGDLKAATEYLFDLVKRVQASSSSTSNH